MKHITEDMPDDAKFAIRKTRVKNSYKYINIASIICLLFVPFWAFVRFFFCWKDSCSGIICVFCELHYVISILLLIFLGGFVWMSLQLYKASKETTPDETLPEKIDNPWIPGVKTAGKALNTLSRTTHTISKKISRIPVVDSASQAAHGIASNINKIPGIELIRKGTAISGQAAQNSAQNLGKTVRHMEHGRELLENDSPALWTFIFTIIAFLIALFFMFGPFKYIFWS